MFDVACIGILVADVIAKPISKIPEDGLLERISSIEMFSGGCAMNTGIDMAKIGLKTAVLGKVGNDQFADFLCSELKKNGVCDDGIVKDPNNQTSSSIVLSKASGERSFLHVVGANNTYSYEDVDWNVVENSKIVFVAGSMLMDKFDTEGCAPTLKKAKEMGKITALDVAWDSLGRWMNVLAPSMPYIDIFMPSYDEAVCLSGEKDLDKMCDVFFDMGVKSCVIKVGSKGCYVRESKDRDGFIVPTYPGDVVDTTGAGDSFCAGFLTGISKGWDFDKCAKFANAVGTFCVGKKGATTGIVSADEILKFIEENDK